MPQNVFLVSAKKRRRSNGFDYEYLFSVVKKGTRISRAGSTASPADLQWFLKSLRASHVEPLKKLSTTSGWRYVRNCPAKTFGHAIVQVFPDKREIVWNLFYPFDWLKEPKKVSVQGKGIGSLLHLQIARHLAQQHPGFSIRHDTRLSISRLYQLKGLGIERREKYPIEEYTAHLEAVVPSWIRQRNSL